MGAVVAPAHLPAGQALADALLHELPVRRMDHRVDRATDQLVRVEAVFRHPRRGVLEAEVQVVADHHVRRRLGQHPVPGLALLQGQLGQLAAGDVPQAVDIAVDLAVAIAQQGRIALDPDILARGGADPEFGLEQHIVEGLPSRQQGEEFRKPLHIVGVDEVPRVPAHQVLRLVAVAPRGTGDEADGAVEGHVQDRVVHVLGHQTVAGLALLQGGTGPGLGGDVPADADDPGDGSVRCHIRLAPEGQAPQGPIGLPDHPDLGGPGLAVPPQGLGQAEHVGLVLRDDAGLDGRLDVQPRTGTVPRQAQNAQHRLGPHGLPRGEVGPPVADLGHGPGQAGQAVGIGDGQALCLGPAETPGQFGLQPPLLCQEGRHGQDHQGLCGQPRLLGRKVGQAPAHQPGGQGGRGDQQQRRGGEGPAVLGPDQGQQGQSADGDGPHGQGRIGHRDGCHGDEGRGRHPAGPGPAHQGRRADPDGHGRRCHDQQAEAVGQPPSPQEVHGTGGGIADHQARGHEGGRGRDHDRDGGEDHQVTEPGQVGNRADQPSQGKGGQCRLGQVAAAANQGMGRGRSRHQQPRGPGGETQGQDCRQVSAAGAQQQRRHHPVGRPEQRRMSRCLEDPQDREGQGADQRQMNSCPESTGAQSIRPSLFRHSRPRECDNVCQLYCQTLRIPARAAEPGGGS